MMYQSYQTTALTEKDLLNVLLADHKRVSREYTTAALEASCQQVRSMFAQLMNETVHMQGELFQLMKQHNMYKQPTQAMRPEIEKQVRSAEQSQQQTQQLVQQILGSQAHQQFQQQALPNQGYPMNYQQQSSNHNQNFQ
jgi:spore coat protein CotF